MLEKKEENGRFVFDNSYCRLQRGDLLEHKCSCMDMAKSRVLHGRRPKPSFFYYEDVDPYYEWSFLLM